MNAFGWMARWWPGFATTLAAVLVISGLLLTQVNWWFFLLCAAGAFGPGILRELGWLHDKDEFQLQAARRAGYHAYLTGGVVSVVLVAYFRSGEREVDFPQELATLFLSLLGFSWFLSMIIGFWGARKGASRIFLTFGVAWLIFTILCNLGPEWTSWMALLLHPLLAAPFFLLAWLAHRQPRLCGVLALGVAAFFFRFFGIFQNPHIAALNQVVVVVFFLGPLLASGLVLLASHPESADLNDSEDDEDSQRGAARGRVIG